LGDVDLVGVKEIDALFVVDGVDDGVLVADKEGDTVEDKLVEGVTGAREEYPVELGMVSNLNTA